MSTRSGNRNGTGTRIAALAAAAAFGGVIVLGAQAARERWRSAGGEPPDRVLATIDGEPITVAAFEREMKRRGGAESFPGRIQRRGLLDDMVREAVWVANARRAGYEQNPDVRREISRLLSGKYRSDHFDAELTGVEVGDDEVRAFYEAHPERFTIPAAAHAALIFFAIEAPGSVERREQIADLAGRVRAAAERQPPTSHFGALAVEQSSDQASRYRGGDVGWVAEGQTDSRWEPAVLDAIFALDQPGSLSPLVTTEKGIYLIRLLGRKPASLRPLDEVAGAIHYQLLSAKRQQRSDEIYSTAATRLNIQVNEERLAGISTPEVDMAEHRPGPPPVPQG